MPRRPYPPLLALIVLALVASAAAAPPAAAEPADCEAGEECAPICDGRPLDAVLRDPLGAVVSCLVA